jgi:hypothetical protein
LNNPAIIIASISAFSLVAVALINAFSVKMIAETRAKIDEVGRNVDGRMQEMLDLTRKSSFAEGVKDEKNVAQVEVAKQVEQVELIKLVKRRLNKEK